MARRHSPRHPLFRQRWFADDIIITCVRWYLRFKLSYWNLAELARELGVRVAPRDDSAMGHTLGAGVREMLASLGAAGRRFLAEWTLTYLKVGGQWVYLYRSVDKGGKTVESYLESNAWFWCKVLKGWVSCD